MHVTPKREACFVDRSASGRGYDEIRDGLGDKSPDLTDAGVAPFGSSS